MSVMLLFYRITRDVNPGLANFRNLEDQQFLLGAIGGLSGKQEKSHLVTIWKRYFRLPEKKKQYPTAEIIFALLQSPYAFSWVYYRVKD